MTKVAATFAAVFWALDAMRVTNDLLLAIGLEESAAKIASVAGILVSVGIIVGQVRRICRWVDKSKDAIEHLEVLFEMDKRLDEFAESVDERIERIEARLQIPGTERRVTDH